MDPTTAVVARPGPPGTPAALHLPGRPRPWSAAPDPHRPSSPPSPRRVRNHDQPVPGDARRRRRSTRADRPYGRSAEHGPNPGHRLHAAGAGDITTLFHAVAGAGAADRSTCTARPV